MQANVINSQLGNADQDKIQELFIEAVKKHEVLYKVDHPQYKSLRVRSQAWREVILESGLETTIEDAKCRWKKLRDSLAESCKRAGRVKWRFRQQMEFLVPYIGLRKRRVKSNVVDLTAEESDALEQSDCTQTTQANKDDKPQNSITEKFSKNQNEQQPQQTINYELNTYTQSFQPQAQNNEETVENSTKTEEQTKDYELYKFFMDMFKEVLRFPDRKKVDVKMKIFNVIIEEERNFLKQNDIRKRSFGLMSNQLQIKKPKIEGSNSNCMPLLTKVTSLAKKTTTSLTKKPNAKQVHLHSKNDKFQISPSSSTNFNNAFLNQVHTESLKNNGNKSTPCTSAVKVIQIAKPSRMARQIKKKESALNMVSHTSIPSTSTAIVIPGPMRSNSVKRGTEINALPPQSLPNIEQSAAVPFTQLQAEDPSLLKLNSAITVKKITIFAQEKPVSQKSAEPDIKPLSIASTSAASDALKIEQLQRNGFTIKNTVLQASCSNSKTKEVVSATLECEEQTELTSQNCLTAEVNSISTTNSTPLTSNNKENVENVLSSAQNANEIQKDSFASSAGTPDKLQKENEETVMSEGTCSDIDLNVIPILLSD